MKLLQVINSLSPGGAEKLIVDAVIKYYKKGAIVDILLINKTSSPFIDKLKDYPEINIFSLGENINVYNPIHIIKFGVFFKNYEVVHVHLFPALYWAAISTMFRKKTYRLVYTEHNTVNRRRRLKIFKIFDKIAYKQFDHIISISDSVDISLKKHLGSKFKNIIKIYNGIDLEEIYNAKSYPKKDINLSPNDIAILQVSSFTAQKNQVTLIKSLIHLPENFNVLLAGEGSMKKNLIELTNELGLDKRVHFLGVRKDIPNLLKSVDVVVLSSHFEGLSLSSVEGLASGKPFIASDVPGLTEVVKDAGILFEDNNDKELAYQIKMLCTDEKQYFNIANKCQKRAKMFDINNMTNKYLELYNKNID